MAESQLTWILFIRTPHLCKSSTFLCVTIHVQKIKISGGRHFATLEVPVYGVIRALLLQVEG